jgi:hypothetical protein
MSKSNHMKTAQATQRKERVGTGAVNPVTRVMTNRNVKRSVKRPNTRQILAGKGL